MLRRARRNVLLRRTGTSSREIIETCLKIEEIYKGPLYVPESGNTSYYLRVRRVYQMKFADCMVRGIEAALGMDDLPSASWLVEAALRQAPLREDVIRCAMRIYDKTGRRREIVELSQTAICICSSRSLDRYLRKRRG